MSKIKLALAAILIFTGCGKKDSICPVANPKFQFYSTI